MSDDGTRTGQVVAVRIAGHEYKIKSEADPDGLREIAGYVDRAMQRVRERTGTVDTLDVAVLTSLNLAREILALREARTPQGATPVEDTKLRDLIEQVEGALLAPPEPAASERSEEGSASVAGEASDEEASPAATTLELPSVDSLREVAEDEGLEEMDPPRLAAGGRDRAS